MWRVLLIAVLTASALGEDLPPSCESKVYCHSDLLEQVELKRVYHDSKTFVDLPMKQDEATTLAAFDKLLNETNDPTREQLQAFVDEYFKTNETELEDWSPPDYSENPAFLAGIRDEKLRSFGKSINDIWPTLGRKVSPSVFEKPDQHSLIPVTKGFIIPGGRFKEIYYWDTYWIIEGLLISGMRDTARGMIENLIELLVKFGHIPNGSRKYYIERSQPPLLTAMVSLYYRETKDWRFVRDNIVHLENELEYWEKTRFVTFKKDGKAYKLLRYFAPSEGPRPESFYQDYTAAQNLSSDPARQQEFYVDIKSAAESGWDFSSRWFIDQEGGNVGYKNIHTRDIIPVDLNAIYANALQNLAVFEWQVGNFVKYTTYASRARQMRSTIEQVLWDDEDGIWYDYDILDDKLRKYFYPSNLSPLWMVAIDKHRVRQKSSRVLKYLQSSHGLEFPGGIPTSLNRTGEQWDFPNAWPPLVSIVINALEALGTREARRTAFNVAETWVRACYQGFEEYKQVFEKYDVEQPGKFGGGGEYTVQAGFGWSNGVVLELLNKYGRILTADDSAVLLGYTVDDKSFKDLEDDSR